MGSCIFNGMFGNFDGIATVFGGKKHEMRKKSHKDGGKDGQGLDDRPNAELSLDEY